MSILGNLKAKLNEKPNSRERLIFLLALVAFVGMFFKACVMESHKSVGQLQEQIEKAMAEQESLKQQTALIGQAAAPNPNASPVDKIAWVGSRDAATKASDALVKSAHEYGVTLSKFSLPDYRDKQNLVFKPVSMTLFGSLGDLGRYLENTEHLEVPLVIENLALEQSADFSDFITLRIEGGFYAER